MQPWSRSLHTANNVCLIPQGFGAVTGSLNTVLDLVGFSQLWSLICTLAECTIAAIVCSSNMGSAAIASPACTELTFDMRDDRAASEHAKNHNRINRFCVCDA